MSTKSDINKNNSLINTSPKKIQPYLYLCRIDRPAGYLLLWIPTLWGLFASMNYMGISFNETTSYIILFLIGSIVMRGAGCTWNDITDIEYDKKVARTKNRPLANGDITKKQAILFLIIQLLIGAIILLFLPIKAVIVSVLAIIPAIIYPFMKRFTYYPQAWLGLTFNWGIWSGWFVFADDNLMIPALLHMAGICWTLSYDTIYAHMDKQDDILIGVKSTALKFGKYTKFFLFIFYSIMIGLFLIVNNILEIHLYGLIAVILCALNCIFFIHKLNINNPKICLKIFKLNSFAGLILALSFLFT